MPAMQRYANRNGNSGVVAFASRPHAVRVKFGHGHAVYEYPADLNGQRVVDEMVRLARDGRGLSTFIARHQPRFRTV